MSKSSFPARFTFLLLVALFLGTGKVAAEPAENTELPDVVCAATLPCRPPAFEVEEGFRTGECATVYARACERWKEVKAKADALDVAAAKLLQCMQDKKKKNTRNK